MGMLFRAYDEELDRPVALKILRPQHQGTDSRTRLLREAQALAKLSHPNVVTVYEVGEWEGHVFIAMELIEGQTLRAWLKHNRWSWREIVDKLLQAGLGLAAAHKAGIVHRDFKPSNVLVGNDGRVRVLDFGLAYAPIDQGSHVGKEAKTPSDSANLLSAPLTVVGAIAGTPPYMAPEQFLGHDVDTRADQYAFCVTLYESLYHQRPFSGRTVKERKLELATAPEPEFPRKPRVPAHLRRILRRGLRFRPKKRYSSMAELLAELKTDPIRRRQKILAASVASIALLWGGYEIAHREAAMRDPCVFAGQLNEFWSTHRQDVETAFLRPEKEYAKRIWQHLSVGLADYANRWDGQQREACQARQAGAYDAELYGTALTCLKQRQFAFEALVNTFTTAKADSLVRALEAADALPLLDRCNDIDALTASVPPPEDPAIAEEVDHLRETLALARTNLELHRHRDGLVQSSQVVARAESLDYAPLQAEALALHGKMQVLAGAYKEAEESLTEALWLADLIHNDELLASTMSSLMRCIGVQRGDYERAISMRRHAETVIGRLGGKTYGESSLLAAMASIEVRRGNSERGVELSGRSLAILEELYGPNDRRTTSQMIDHGVAHSSNNDRERADELYKRALEIMEAQLGPGHPALARPLNNLGAIRGAQNDPEGSLPYFERSLEITESVFGPGHPAVAQRLANIGLVYAMLGHLDESRVHLERALAIEEEFRGPDHLNVARLLGSIGEILLEEGEYEAAKSRFERAYQVVEKQVEPHSRHLFVAIYRLGAADFELGNNNAAVSRLRTAYESLSKDARKNDTQLGAVSLYLALAYERSKDPKERVQWQQIAREAVMSYRESDNEEKAARIEAWIKAPSLPFERKDLH